MDRCLKQWTAVALVWSTLSASVAIVCAESNDINQQLNDLQEQLNAAAVANKAVRVELDEARDTHYNDNWINEERASSIMSLVEDVLMDSQERVNLYGDGSMMGWNDGFYMSSADGLFSLKIGGLLQTQFMSRWVGTNEDTDEWTQGFGVSRTELNFGGHVFGKGLEYYMSLGWGRYDPSNLTNQGFLMSPRLWESWVKFKLNNETSIKMGQFSLPFTREALVGAPYQMAVFPSLVEYRFGLSQSTGIELEWQNRDRRFSVMASNGSPALFQATLWGSTDPTPPWAALQSDTLYSFTMRHEWKILGDWSQFNQFTSPPGSERGLLIGIAGHRQNTEWNSPDPIGGFPDGVFWGVTGDITMQFDGASLFASIIYERVLDFAPLLPRINILTFVAQGSTYISNQTELFARWESGGPDRESVGGDHLQVLTVGMNHYIDGQDVKFTADFGFSFGEVSVTMENPQAGWATNQKRRDQAVLRTQLQLMF